MEYDDKTGEMYTIITDPIHKVIKMHPLWIKIIDTPEFQRLRFIKQLGCSFFVNPSATHTRFEHSVGTCVLAWRMAQALQTQCQEITDSDVLCVSIAGLCHDLGHGAFSDTWQEFMETVAPKKQWKIEEMSVKIFARIWNKLTYEHTQKQLFNLGKDEQVLIGDLIRGKNSQIDNPVLKKKNFLFEIVNNKINGIDVDKWDYLARDAYYLGINISIDHERLIQSARVVRPKEYNEKEKEMIYYEHSEILNFYQMFYIRWLLHHKVYQHQTVRIIDKMIIEAMVMANEKIFPGKKLSELSDDVESFLELDDSIFHSILKLPSDDNSRKIIQNIQKRELYKCKGCALSPLTTISKMAKKYAKFAKTEMSDLKFDDFYVDVVKISSTKSKEEVVKYIPIFNKETNSTSLENISSTIMLTNSFAKTKISFISRKTDDRNQKYLADYFEKWFQLFKDEDKLRKSH